MKINVHWGSHLAVMSKILHVTEGPILELGVGVYSTPYLHWMCEDKGFNLESFEKVEKYYKQFTHAQTDSHKITRVDNWDDADIERHWGMALVDHEEERRPIEAIRLAKFADYVVLHDTTGGTKRAKKVYRLKEVFSHYKYKVDFKQFYPTTTVLSNTKDLSFLKFEYITIVLK